MIRNIVKIDSDRCIGCGKCAEACAEGAIKMINGKAALVSDVYCDGLGACLPSCPVDAISIEKREAAPFVDPTTSNPHSNTVPVGGIPMTSCPGSGVRVVNYEDSGILPGSVPSRLSQWPIQLRLIPATAPYLNGCDLLVAADCSAFAFGNYHDRFIKGRKVIIGCPKLDPADCWNKLKDIVSMNNIKSITVTRMDVPCCFALVNAVRNAIESSGKNVPLKVFTIFADGQVRENS